MRKVWIFHVFFLLMLIKPILLWKFWMVKIHNIGKRPWILSFNLYKIIKFGYLFFFVVTLTLGLRPRQGVARVWVKKKTQESHHILPGVQRVWGHEPSHSQVNSHVGSWNLEWTFESSERDCRGQNSSAQRILYIIEKKLKRRCLKWAYIAHLNICNTSYGQKKGQESNCH